MVDTMGRVVLGGDIVGSCEAVYNVVWCGQIPKCRVDSWKEKWTNVLLSGKWGEKIVLWWWCGVR